MNKYAGLLMAAGSSQRFNGIKQLAPMADKTLLQHTCHTLCASSVDQVWVVLGAYREQLAPLLPANVSVVGSQHWQLGLGANISLGVSELTDDYTHILLTLADQVALTVADFNRLLALSAHHPQHIIAAKYAQVVGVPVIFPKACFTDLIQLTGDSGARKLLKETQIEMKEVEMERAAIDIDTPLDWQHWQKNV